MSDRSSKGNRRVGFFIFLMVSQVLLVTALWQYHQVLVALYDDAVSQLYGRITGQAPSRDDLFGKSVRAAIYQPVTDASDPTFAHQDALVRVWGEYLDAEAFGYRVLSSIQHPNDLARYHVLILPSITQMSDAEIDSVKAFARNGGGVLMGWATGTRDEEGRWRTDSLLNHMAGITMGDEPVETEENISTLLLSSRASLNAGLPPQFHLKVRRYDRPLSGWIREPRTHSAGTWLVPNKGGAAETVPDLVPTAHSGIVYGEYLSGRFVWFGFTVASAVNDPEQLNAFQTVLRNSLLWAGRQVQAFKAIWPQEKTSAFGVSVLVRTQADLDERIFSLARKHSLPLTLYVTESLMADPSIPWQDLSKQFELAWLDDDQEKEDNPDRSFREEVRRFRDTAQLLRRLNGDRRLGYRRADGTSDDRMSDALVRAGFTYYSASDAEHSIPEIVRSYHPIRLITRPRELWMLPEEGHQDTSRIEPAAQAYTLSRDVGGYLNLILDPAQCSNAFLEGLDLLLQRIKQDNVWAASAGEIADHARVWGHLKISPSYSSSSRVGIQISNSGLEPIRDVTFFIAMGRPVSALEIKPTTLGSPNLQGSRQDDLVWKLYLSSIPPGKNYAYYVRRVEE